MDYSELLQQLSAIISTGELPPHRLCLVDDWLIWLMFASNVGVFVAYILIPIGLLTLLPVLNSTMHVNAEKVIFASIRKFIYLFVAFIILCGGGHLLDAINLFNTYYWFQAYWNLTTATISLATALSMFLVSLDVRHQLRRNSKVKQRVRNRVKPPKLPKNPLILK